MTDAPRTPTVLAAEMYLLLFPAGHLVLVPLGGAMATAADAALLALLLAWGWDLVARAGVARGVRDALFGAERPDLPPARILRGLLILTGLGVWVAVSALWGFHGAYAAAKGTGMVGLGLGALAIATSGIGWRRAADAWLGGAALTLALTLVIGVAGPGVLRERVLAGGVGILGLPFPRISGPFLHANMLGDYLMVSGLLLWGRWPDWAARARGGALAFAGALAIGLLLTASTAWIGAGVAAVLIGRGLAREGHGGKGALLRVGGMAAAGGTFVLLVLPLDVRFLGFELVTGAIRPAIWRSSLAPFFENPLLGVGAAPFLAEAADRLQAGQVGLWDAHNAYLSILGQFGVVGAALAATGAWYVATRVPGRDSGRSRAQAAVGLALLAVAVDALFLASEDLRHVWILMGMAGVVAAERRGAAS